MGAVSGRKRESWLRIPLAILAGGVVFPVWLAGPYGLGPLALGFGLRPFLPSANPITMEIVRWAGAGVLAALAIGCLAPRWRWAIVPPLLFFLEFGWWFFLFFVLGHGDIAIPPGTYPGLFGGFALGLVIVLPCHAHVRTSRRLLLLAAALLALFVVMVGAALLGRNEMNKVRGRVLPAVERLLREDVLADPGTVDWTFTVRGWHYKDGVCTYAYGDLRRPKMQILVRWLAKNPLPKPGALEGLRTDGLKLQLEQRPQSDISKSLAPEEVTRLLRTSGLKSELLARLVVTGWPPHPKHWEAISLRAVGTYHGVIYNVDWSSLESFECSRLDLDLGRFLIQCQGSYSAAAR